MEVKLWAALYALVWIGFIEIVLVVVRGLDIVYLIDLHVLVGFVAMGLAYYNSSGLRKTTAPARIKRIANVAFGMSIGSAVTGVILYIPVHSDISLTDYICFLSFIHVLFTIAMLTQASSVATSYDMWEEKEFLEETQPGEAPKLRMEAPQQETGELPGSDEFIEDTE